MTASLEVRSKAEKKKNFISFFLFKNKVLAPSETTAQHHSPAPQPSTQLKGALLCFVVSKEHREFIGSVTQAGR
jgi:hypothetical protein